MTRPTDREVIEPEVLPPERGASSAPPGPSDRRGGRALRAFGPILAGAAIDAIDYVTMGVPGLVIGALAAFWLCTINRVPLLQRLLCAVAAGVYCALPFRRFLPVATLVGAYIQFAGPVRRD